VTSIYSRYEVTFANPNTTWARAAAMVGDNSVVLDVGCSAGQFAEALTTSRGCVVDGVEIEAEAAEVAKTRCRDVFVGDLLTVIPRLSNLYDHVLMLDVIEHLADPGGSLAAAASVLRPTGTAVVSVPNMAHASVRLQLLQGHFPPTEEGLLDRTHLHFFDEFTFLDLISASPLVCETLDRVLVDVPRDVVVDSLKAVGLPLTERFEDLIWSREASTYQFVAKLRHRGPDELSSPAPRPAYVAPLDQYRSLLGQLQDRIARLEGELRERAANSIRLPKRLLWAKRLLARLRSR